MDALAGLLDGPRARGAFLLRMVMDPPWSVRIEDEAPLAVMAMVRGTAWIVPDDGEPVHMQPGDLAVARGPDHYTAADDPASRPQVIVHPGERCTTLGGHDLAEEMALGVRTWGTSVDGPTSMLVGTYQSLGEIGQRLLGALPPLLVLPADAWDSPLVQLLSQEMVKEDPGQEAVLDRLLDLLVIAALRTWFSRPDVEAPAWFRAHGDPVVGHALRLLHNNPAYPWTVATLAAEIGVARATLARRFREQVGEPPMSFLTDWRLTLAADLLREPGTTIGAVAQQVGYSSPFALSTAFKRSRGVSPQQHRAMSVAAS